ncbi:MAG: NorD protein, partial [Cyclobacteriaceae bacterium]|nr:NorD protein [Cyclobacteriaceae bacterium]
MDLDEILFTKVAFYFKRKRKKKALLQCVDLETLRPKLTILSRAFTGRSIDIVTSEREGGWKNNAFFLPESIDFLPQVEGNVSFYLFRILYLSVQQKRNFNWKYNEDKTLEESREIARTTSDKVLDQLFIEYPVCKEMYQNILQYLPDIDDKSKSSEKDTSWVFGKWMKNDLEKSSNNPLKHVSEKHFEKKTITPTTEIKAKPVEEIEVVQVDEKQQEEYVINHNFEKVETAEEFSGVWRDFDGDDTLSDDANALDEVNMKHVVRVDDPAHSVYQAEFAENATIAESSEAEAKGHFELYDEWDYKKTSYKKSFCKVFPKKVKG